MKIVGDFFLGARIKYLDDRSELGALKKAVSYATANCLEWFPEINQKKADRIFHQIEVVPYS
ncbi:hypothetical protein EWH99_10860 [Sporolactobacillus sp. THM7-7]|nr:hypothetical protein EWH99_10860 [Sporolactobacillus sp. THM7-7]